MEPIRKIVSRTAVLPYTDIDTDQIIPARFLRTTTREGLGKQLFSDWRYNADGSERAEFPLNQPQAKGCTVLVGGRNFDNDGIWRRGADHRRDPEGHR